MPLHDLGYRKWEGQKTPLLGRWLVVASTGISLAFRSTWLSRTLVLALVPTIVAAVFFFFFEQSTANEEYREIIQGVAQTAGGSAELLKEIGEDPEAARSDAWASIMLMFFRYPQSFAMLIVVGIVAPRLISYDLRNRGYLLYFSRPIQINGYILGKALVICAFLAMITTLPALGLYFLGLCLSPDTGVILLTWDLPVRIIVASLVLMIPVASIALACSAFTVESRYAAFAWFTIWIVGWVSYGVLRIAEIAGIERAQRAGRRGRRFRDEELSAEQLDMIQYSDWEFISPFHVLGRVQQYVYGLYPDDKAIWPFIAILVGITVVCLWFVRRQIKRRLTA